MDGYHLTRMQLSLLPNPAHAHARRGAAFTFDADALLSLIRSIRALPVPTPSNPLVPPLFAPSFDHARKDPVPDDIRVDPACRVVVFEGNYLALAKGVWAEIGAEMDEVWFVDVDREVAVRRLVERHVRSGVAGSMEEAEGRARGNDWDNGTEILGNLVRVGERVFSVEEEGWEERVVGEEDEVEELN
jgi:pantothenate kinase